MMLDLDSKLQKKKGADFFALDEDLDDEWIKQHHAFLVEEQRQKIQKKFEKDNEKRVADGEKEMKDKELQERLGAVKELEAKYKKELKKKKVEAEGRGVTVEKLEAQLAKLDQRIENMTLQAEDKENNKEVALGTSKIVSPTQFFPRADRLVCNVRPLTRVCKTAELYRPASHRRIFQEVRRSDRKVLLKDLARKVRVGDQVRR
jgi:hypothetical protein